MNLAILTVNCLIATKHHLQNIQHFLKAKAVFKTSEGSIVAFEGHDLFGLFPDLFLR